MIAMPVFGRLSWPFRRDPHAIAGGLSPEFVADFAGVHNGGQEFFRANGATTTYSALYGTSADRTGTATMVDSDGLLKWGAHNLLPYSTDLTQWANLGTSDSGQVLTASAGAGDHAIYDIVSAGLFPSGRKMVAAARVTPGTHDFVCVTLYGRTTELVSVVFDLSDGTVGENFTGSTSGTFDSATVTANGDGSYTLRVFGSAGTGTGNGALISFAAAKTGNTFDTDGIPQFTAAGTETFTLHAAWNYRNDLGGMVEVPADERAFSDDDDYVSTSGAARYLLRRNAYYFNAGTATLGGAMREGERTNEIPYFAEFDNANWTKTDATISADSDTAPDGTDTADTVTDNSANFGKIRRTVAYSATLAASIDVKKDAIPRATRFCALRINFTGGTTNNFDVSLDTSTGDTSVALSSHVPFGFGAEDEGDYWRLWVVGTDAGSNTTPAFEFFPAIGASDFAAYAAATTGSCVIWGAQIEPGSFPTSLIPTTGATATRTADAVAAPAAKVPASSTALWASADLLVSYADNNVSDQIIVLEQRDGASDFLRLSITTNGGFTGAGRATTFVSAGGGGNQQDGTLGATPGVNVAFNLAARFTNDGVQVARDGSAGTEAASSAMPAGISDNDLYIGSSSSGGNEMSGFIRMVRAGTGDPGDAGIEAASS